MLIKTKYFGEIEIDETNIIKFDNGMLGFEVEKEFIVLDLFQVEDFTCLQSMKNDEIAFILIKPWKFYPDYDVDISNEELKDINIKEEKQVALYNVVTIEENFNDATANLLAPVIINIDKNIGRQYVLKEDVYSTRHRIFPKEKV